MNKKPLIAVITLVLIAVGLSGCTEDGNTGDTGTEGNKSSSLGYSNQEYGFGLNPPNGWSVDEDSLFGIVRFHHSTNQSTINLYVLEPTPLGPGGTLDDAVNNVLNTYPMYMENFTLISSNTGTVNGMDAHEIVYTITSGSYLMKNKQVMIEANDMVFSIWYSAIQSSYDTYTAVVGQSIQSFTVDRAGNTNGQNDNGGNSGLDSKLFGTWTYVGGDGTSTVTFFSDGTFSSNEVEGTYTLTDGKLVFIYSDGETTGTYEYSFSDNDNTLTLTSMADGTINVLKKQ